MPRLVVAFPTGLRLTERGSVMVDEKLRSGIQAYARLWPGEVVLATPDTGALIPAPGTHAVSAHDLGFHVQTGSTWAEAVEEAKPDLLLAPLVPRVTELRQWLARTVLVAERTPEDLTAWELRTAASSVSRARIRAGAHRRERLYRSLVRQAPGVQCNGHPAHDRFSEMSPAPLLFFDARITGEHVKAAERTGRGRPASEPHLCFSGRLAPEKGPEHAIEVVRRLRNGGVQARLTVLGLGPLERQLRAMAAEGVEFRGALQFADEWTRFAREEVDLFVLPHLIGDPSGTYLEAAGCGVPVVGFANLALQSLAARHGLGLTVPVGDTEALTRSVGHLLADARKWADSRERGLRFMAEHDFASEAQRRVEHLLAVSAELR